MSQLPEVPAGSPDLRSYGRRKGRKASPRQVALLETLLPRVRVPSGAPAMSTVDDVRALGPAGCRAIWLEIGFGGGEHLVWQARTHPDVLLLGCEPFLDGVVKVLDAIEHEGLGNIRLHADDARALLRALPAASVDRVFILFPDPWPKLRHRKRRLVNSETIREVARVMAPGGELRLGTDIGDYAAQMLDVVLRSDAFTWLADRAADWRERPADWPPTRYEQKALREGRRCAYLRFRRGQGSRRFGRVTSG